MMIDTHRRSQELESLLVELLVQKYLVEKYHSTAYTTVVYLITGPLAMRLTRVPRDRLKTDAHAPKIECSFRGATRKSKGKAAKASSIKGDKKAGKRKRQSQSSEEEDNEDEDQEMDDFIIEEDEDSAMQQLANHSRRPTLPEAIDDSDQESEIPDWTYSMRDPPLKKQRTGNKPVIDNEVIELSD
jgi:ATP-dependent DNA helicase Q1